MGIGLQKIERKIEWQSWTSSRQEGDAATRAEEKAAPASKRPGALGCEPEGPMAEGGEKRKPHDGKRLNFKFSAG
jgi:hypothetical protein